MATKSLFLPWLLMGMCIAQNAPPPEEWHCEFSPEDVTKYHELFRCVKEMPLTDRTKCLVHPSLPDSPGCEPVQELYNFMEEKCHNFPPSDVLAHAVGDANGGPRAISPVSDEEDSSPSSVTDDHYETIDCHRDATVFISSSSHGDHLVQRDAGEPYHHTLKPIYDACDILEDPGEHTMCVIAKLQSALCDKEPWIQECHGWKSGKTDEPSSESLTLDQLDAIRDTGRAVPFADDDELHRRTARPIG